MPSSARPLRLAYDLSGEGVGNHVRNWPIATEPTRLNVGPLLGAQRKASDMQRLRNRALMTLSRHMPDKNPVLSGLLSRDVLS
jgi:hypothetical protein